MPRRVLIGTIGYHNLRNHSLGLILQSRIEALDFSGLNGLDLLFDLRPFFSFCLSQIITGLQIHPELR